MVILKRPAVKEADNDFEHHHKYPIGALVQSHELAPTKFSEPKALQPTLPITTPMTGITERPLAQQASQDLERPNDQAARPPPLSPPLPEYNGIKGSAILAD